MVVAGGAARGLREGAAPPMAAIFTSGSADGPGRRGVFAALWPVEKGCGTEVLFGVSFSLFTLRGVVLCRFRCQGCGGVELEGSRLGTPGRVATQEGGGLARVSAAASIKPLAVRSLGVRGSSYFLEAKMCFASWASCWSWKAVLESSAE